MLSNNYAYAQFQKRRRKSTPTSPVSPVSLRFPVEPSAKNLETPQATGQSPALNIETHSPSVEADLPSPSFDGPSLSASSSPSVPRQGLLLPYRASDELTRQRKKDAYEALRPATSASSSPYTRREQQAPGGHTVSPQQFSSNFNSAALERAGHVSQDTPADHNDHTRFSMRNVGSSPLGIERLNFDDSPSNRGSGPKKSRLNLLNPMSLLARRRSSQAYYKEEDANLSITSLAVPAMPDDYDPRIRGKIFHDFSAPRNRRIHSYNDVSSAEASPVAEVRQNPNMMRRASDLAGLGDSPASYSSPSPKHSPAFKEHFSDDRAALQPGQKGYLHTFATSRNARLDPMPASLPAFARKLPTRIPENSEPASPEAPAEQSLDTNVDTPLKDLAHAGDIQGIPDENQKTSGEIRSSPPKWTPSTSLRLPHSSLLPKHMTSTSSRFSFQLGGVDSAAQERLLEEKHRIHEASKRDSSSYLVNDLDDLDDGGYDIDGDDGFEERIPGVNVDADDEYELPKLGGVDNFASERATESNLIGREPNDAEEITFGLDTFHFTPESALISPANAQTVAEPTPRDDLGRTIGVAASKDSPSYPNTQLEQPEVGHNNHALGLSGLGITTDAAQSHPASNDGTQSAPHQNNNFDEEDIYFDDGEFDDVNEIFEEQPFDESLFDDEAAVIRDIPQQNAANLEAARAQNRISVNSMSSNAGISGGLDQSGESVTQRTSGEYQAIDIFQSKQPAAHAHPLLKPSSANLGPQAGLTEGNLAAYHDALVSAAHEAATNGRFARTPSISQHSEDQISPTPQEDGQHVRFRHNLGSSFGEEDGFGYDDDDDMDDDLLIAEANAEVLENDEDGFYGQEFGFFARASRKGDSEMVNGGFFGPRGTNAIKRSHSGKANFQEPNLTPITERSEWSPRNSVASLQIPMLPGSAHSIPSPGLAQIIDSESWALEEEMSFSALRKLRRGAFGGSQASINSLTGSHVGSSPLAHASNQALLTLEDGHRRVSSKHSLAGSAGIPESEEQDNEDEDDVDYPTLTQSTPRKQSKDVPAENLQQTAVLSPTLEPVGRARVSHSRTSSGAESVSYVRDPDGSGRWLLERSRMGDDGETEVIGREYVAGMRI